MTPIKGDLDVRLTLAEVNTINDLIAKDKARPARKVTRKIDGEDYTSFYCPVCDNYIGSDDCYCRTCGQHIDTENTAL